MSTDRTVEANAFEEAFTPEPREPGVRSGLRRAAHEMGTVANRVDMAVGEAVRCTYDPLDGHAAIAHLQRTLSGLRPYIDDFLQACEDDDTEAVAAVLTEYGARSREESEESYGC